MLLDLPFATPTVASPLKAAGASSQLASSRAASTAAKRAARQRAIAPAAPAAATPKPAAADPAPAKNLPVPKFTKDPTYLSTKATGSLALDDYDAQSLLGRQQATASHDYQSQLLNLATTDSKNDTAEDFAGRGVIRSGAYLGAQDKVDASGVQQQASIDQDLTDYVNQRTQGRLDVQTSNRDKLNTALSKLQSAYYASQKKAS